MGWGTFSSQTFIKLRPGCSPSDLNPNMANFLQTHAKGEDALLSLLPFTRRNMFFTGKERSIYIFSVIVFFILLIACINFMNLSTARSANRAVEIGIRKVTGAYRRSIIIQFISESLLLSLIALIFAFILAAASIPVFNAIIGVEISPGILHIPTILLVILGLVLFTGLAAGSYPALFLSAFPGSSLRMPGSVISLTRKWQNEWGKWEVNQPWGRGLPIGASLEKLSG